LLRAALQQFDERVAGDLLGEPGAAGAGHAALPVQQDLAGQRDRLGEGALGPGEPGLAAAVGHGLVLQRALAALVAHGAVEGVVDQEELHHPGLRLLGHRRGEMGAHLHPVGAGGRARGERLGLPFHLDEALPARAHRIEQRMVTEPGDLDSEQLGGADHQHALGHGDLEAVDGDGHPLLHGRQRARLSRSHKVTDLRRPRP
jgi:hypothetical protein